MFRNLVAAVAALSLVACTSLRPLPAGDRQWRDQVHVGDDVSVAASNGKTYLLTLTEVDDEKIVGIGDNKKVTIRYAQIQQLELRKLNALKTSAAVGGGVLAVVGAVLLFAIIAFQNGWGIEED
ncbi:MAG: hypothetical protein Q8Q73_17440 [Stagnimonas sp.]|nr:hypothetical protein [Stagnimonas sp.]